MKWLFCLLMLPVMAADWALTDPDKGWNERELIDLYYHNSELQRQWAWEALSHYHFRGNERVLDFGAGDGKITAMVSRMVPEGSVLGTDLSAHMTTFAAKMFPRDQYSNLSFARQAEEADKFDLITAFCVFNVIPDPVAVLSDLHRRLTPDGRLVITLPIGRNPDYVAALLEELPRWNRKLPAGTEGRRSMRDPKRVPDLLAQAGFDIEFIAVVHTRNAFGSPSEFVQWQLGTMSANWDIPPDIRRSFFESFTQRYLEKRPDALDKDGFFYFDLDRIDLVAVKKSAE